ncbi:PQQ-dependent catabolism-associated CXXCW motif protein [Roseibium salinum]|uniref:PQQ-dependent catabolism-associated CXXCW motif protein n=1 Tax=Roseibium salinum TaxID=1604349 RepID=A0ABT3R466_9HYPH|nr:PQQ-dependent catabolism-associated CXXCW motif protein [Roseibium sp. DSM 29163]MCX2723990.1 PQQ-dependent catabolism-associated CXXCW motif protein [Roseibium sp. DSM 29163]
MIIPRLVLLCLLAGTSAAGAQGEPHGYREDNYRAPVPGTLAGATVISSDAAYALWKTGRVAFVDVLPRPPKPSQLPEGTIWREPARHSIPGAVWLPNVGYGQLAGVMHDYFRAGLEKVTKDDAAHPVVFFCLDDCWMSWNAAKRALEYGYSNVFWYPDGTDGWSASGYPAEQVQPEPGGQ